MDLPVELRLMVYERMPIRTTRRYIYQRGYQVAEKARNSVAFITRGVDVGILATCKPIHAEATKFLIPKMEILQSSHPQMVVKGGGTWLTEDIMPKIITWLRIIQKEGKQADFESWWRGLENQVAPRTYRPTSLPNVDLAGDIQGKYRFIQKTAMHYDWQVRNRRVQSSYFTGPLASFQMFISMPDANGRVRGPLVRAAWHFARHSRETLGDWYVDQEARRYYPEGPSGPGITCVDFLVAVSEEPVLMPIHVPLDEVTFDPNQWVNWQEGDTYLIPRLPIRPLLEPLP
jgi:hypothetical protein